MPEYLFVCRECRREVTVTASIKDGPGDNPTCSSCHGQTRRVYASATHIPDTFRAINPAKGKPN